MLALQEALERAVDAARGLLERAQATAEEAEGGEVSKHATTALLSWPVCTMPNNNYPNWLRYLSDDRNSDVFLCKDYDRITLYMVCISPGTPLSNCKLYFEVVYSYALGYLWNWLHTGNVTMSLKAVIYVQEITHNLKQFARQAVRCGVCSTLHARGVPR